MIHIRTDNQAVLKDFENTTIPRIPHTLVILAGHNRVKLERISKGNERVDHPAKKGSDRVLGGPERGFRSCMVPRK
jgi:hypothetical protein